MNINHNKYLDNLNIKSYVRDPWPILLEYGYNEETVLDCSLGVNPFGPCSSIKDQTFNLNWNDIERYPDPGYPELTTAIIDNWRRHIQLTSENINITSGSSGGLINVVRLLLNSGSKVLGYTPQFGEMKNLANIVGAKYEAMDLDRDTGYKFDVERFVDLIDDSYNMIYIDNPNNPTGQIIDPKDIKRIAQRAKEKGVALVVDEAYGGFMYDGDSAINLIEDFDNVLVLRSFSKGMGLANLRIGYIVFHERYKKIYSEINIPPFVIPDIIQSIAITALDDKKYLINSAMGISMISNILIRDLKDLYKFSISDPRVPIVLMGWDKDEDLYSEMLKVGVIATAGSDFDNVDRRYVRLRVSLDVEDLINRLKRLQGVNYD